jgi:hypothetical protein
MMKTPGTSGFKITHDQDYSRNWERGKELIPFIEDANNRSIKLFWGGGMERD